MCNAVLKEGNTFLLHVSSTWYIVVVGEVVLFLPIDLKRRTAVVPLAATSHVWGGVTNVYQVCDSKHNRANNGVIVLLVEGEPARQAV